MKEDYSKFCLVLGGDLCENFSMDVIKDFIRQWANDNGTRNVSSGVVRCDMNEDDGVIVYSAHFDSSHWTGIGFEGFDKKNPGEPQTL